MLPALPTGSASASGARPSASTTSKAAVCCPVSRSGLIELTTTASPSSPRRRTAASAASKLPSTMISRAPAASAWASLPRATLPAGRTTKQGRPAAAAYAAADALVLPVDAHTTAFAPAATARLTGQDHAPVLERPGRVGALELEVKVLDADLGAEAPGADERSATLPQRDRKALAVAGDQVAIALEEWDVRPHRLSLATPWGCGVSVEWYRSMRHIRRQSRINAPGGPAAVRTRPIRR